MQATPLPLRGHSPKGEKERAAALALFYLNVLLSYRGSSTAELGVERDCGINVDRLCRSDGHISSKQFKKYIPEPPGTSRNQG